MLNFLNVGKVLRGYQRAAKSYADLLPWACPWDERTVLTRDQGLLAVFDYDGIDAEGRPQYEVDGAVASFERAFAGFRSGNFVWSIVDRQRSTRYPAGRKGDAAEGTLAEFVEGQWSAQTTASQYENSYSLAIFQRANEGSAGFLDSMDRIVKENGVGLVKAFLIAARARLSVKESIRLNDRVVRAASEQLELRVDEVQSGMGGLNLRRLSGERLMGYLLGRANPVTGGRESFAMPKLISQFLDGYLSADSVDRLPKSLVFSDGDKDRYVGVISLKGWPDGGTMPGQLDYLLAVDGEVTLAHCFHFVDRDVAAKAIESVEKFNITASVPFLHRIYTTFANQEPSKFEPGRVALAEDARTAKVDLVANGRAFGFHNLTILCYGDTEAEMDDVRAQIMRRLKESQFTGRVEGMHQLSAFSQTLPGQWRASVRWSQVSFGNAADIAPIRTLQAGSLESPHFTKEMGDRVQPAFISMPTDAGVPFNWDFTESGAGHSVFVGPTRAGKTALVNMLLAIFRKYHGSRVIRIDKDYSARIPTILAGGTHIDLRPDAGPGLRMCPVSLVKDATNHNFVIGWVRRLLETLGGKPLSPDEIDSLSATIRNLQTLPPETHTLASVRAGIGSLGRLLDDWISDGSMAGWFDNPASDVELGDDVCFEMKRLFDNELVAEMAMDYIFYLIEKSLDGRPLIVNVEETWFFLKNARFVARLDDFLRTIGKRMGSVWMTTQSAYELTSNENLLPLLEQIKNRIFLPNKSILSARAGYDRMGLTEEQLIRIYNAEPKRDYYFQTASRTRMAHVRIPPSVLPVLESGARAQAVFDKHYRSGVPDWDQAYYNEMTGELA